MHRGYIRIKRHDEDDDDDDIVIHHHTHHHHEGKHHAMDHEHHHAVREVMERVKDHPASWEPYIGQDGGAVAIVKMEYAELMEAKSSGSKHAMRKELEDLAAACIHALKTM